MQTAQPTTPPIKVIQSRIAEELETTNKTILEQIECGIPLVREVAEHLINSGGKRARPTIVLLVAKALDFQGTEHITLSTIVEFIHTATLFHDDVIDGSEMRRGKLTANHIWDNTTSVLVGDFLYSRSIQLTASLANQEITEVFADTTNKLVQGEILQMHNAGNTAIGLEDYFETIRRKTAYLFAAATKSAAIISQAPVQQQQALYEYGLNLGIAFQLADDALDFNGDQAELGKNVGDDLAEGKLTLPLIHALQHANADQKQVLTEAIKNKNTENLPGIISILQDTKALIATQQLAEEYTNKAIGNLSCLDESTYKEALIELARFVTLRSQ